MALKENTDWQLQFAIDDTTQSPENQITIYSTIPWINQWIHLVATVTTSASKFYINGSLVQSSNWYTKPWWNWSRSYDNTQWVFCSRDVWNFSKALNWNARELIMEQVEWSAVDVDNYYNRSKSKFWL